MQNKKSDKQELIFKELNCLKLSFCSIFLDSATLNRAAMAREKVISVLNHLFIIS